MFHWESSLIPQTWWIVLVTQACPTLCHPMDCSPPGSSVHGILQARILEWVAIPFSRGSSWSRDRIQFSYIAGRFFTLWATREAQDTVNPSPYFRSYQARSWTYLTLGGDLQRWGSEPKCTLTPLIPSSLRNAHSAFQFPVFHHQALCQLETWKFHSESLLNNNYSHHGLPVIWVLARWAVF